MRKSRLSLLVVATVISTILVAGCTSPTQTSPQVASTNTSTSSTTASTTTTASSSAVKTVPSVTPSTSASVSPTPTASPQPSAKIATSIEGTQSFNSNPTITRNSPVSWGFEVVPTGSAQLLSVPVPVKIDNKAIGTVTPVSGGTETVGFSFSPSSLAPGQHTITVSFAGDSTYKGTQQAFPFQIS